MAGPKAYCGPQYLLIEQAIVFSAGSWSVGNELRDQSYMYGVQYYGRIVSTLRHACAGNISMYRILRLRSITVALHLRAMLRRGAIGTRQSGARACVIQIVTQRCIAAPQRHNFGTRVCVYTRKATRHT